MANTRIDRYGVIGYPVSHSRSPIIHRLFALQTGQNLQYELLQVASDKLESAIRQFQSTGGRGLNVTLPHKSEVARLADRLSERAKRAGAVNTLAFEDDEITGDNTDGSGLMRDLITNFGLKIRGAKILILGAGGANRTEKKAAGLADYFSSYGPVSACRFDAVNQSESYDLVINATSAGLKGETPPYPERAIGRQTFCYDLSYGLTPTPFSSWAAAQGAAQSVMGWGMLVEQAAESFHIWRGVRPDTVAVLRQMTISA